MNKILIRIFRFMMIVLFGLIVARGGVSAQANDWQEMNPMERMQVFSDQNPGHFELRYTFEFPWTGKSVSQVSTTRPNVYLFDRRTGREVHHLWRGDIRSTGNFLLGLPKNGDMNNYDIFSTAGTNARIFTRSGPHGTEVRAVSQKIIPGHGDIELEVDMMPLGNQTIHHNYTVKNIGNTPLTFVAMKSVDTELAGNDHVPVRMLGDNEGLYIEADRYRLDYIMDIENGPKNFRNWFTGGYRAPLTDTFENSLYLPFYPNQSLAGVGDETKYYQPDEAVNGRGDSGIWMKWEQVTIQPGESKTFSYDISINGPIKAYQTATPDAVYAEDDIVYEQTVRMTTRFGQLLAGSISNQFDYEVTFVNDTIEVVDSVTGQVLRSIRASDHYDPYNRTLKISVGQPDVVGRQVKLRYTVKVDPRAANGILHTQGFYSMFSHEGEQTTRDSTEVQIKPYISYSVQKQWVGGPDAHPSVKIQLFRNEQPFREPIELLNGETDYSFSDLRETDEHDQPYRYTVAELDPPANYIPSVEYGTSSAVITNTYTSPRRTVTAVKNWVGGPGQKPTIYFKLYRQTNDSVEKEAVADAELKELPDGTSTVSWADLPQTDERGREYQYSVEETDATGTAAVPQGYVSENPTGLAVTNTNVETVTLSGQKIWDDANDQDGKRAEQIKLWLLADGHRIQEKEVTAATDWQYSFADLPKYAAGELVEYTIEEEAVPGYTPMYDGTNVTNRHLPETIDIMVDKHWADADDQDGKRPDLITVELWADEEKVEEKSITQAADGSWSTVFVGVPKYKAGEEILYSVREVAVDQYSTEIDQTDGQYTITNRYTPEKITVAGQVIWDDAADQDGLRPAKTTIELVANQTVIGQQTVSAEEHWQFVFSDLDRYQGGQEIQYSVRQLAVPGGYTETMNGYRITNHHTPQTITLSGRKSWIDQDDREGRRPQQITVYLLADGQETGLSLQVSEEQQWQYQFANVAKMSQGKEIVYTVREEAVAGYSTRVEGMNLFNTYITPIIPPVEPPVVPPVTPPVLPPADQSVTPPVESPVDPTHSIPTDSVPTDSATSSSLPPAAWESVSNPTHTVSRSVPRTGEQKTAIAVWLTIAVSSVLLVAGICTKRRLYRKNV